MSKRESGLLFVGDILVFTLSLWVVLFIRYLALPSKEIFLQHIIPFSILFILWSLIFFIAGLYEKRVLIIKRRLFTSIFNVQLINSIIAAAFFYFASFFNIAPKTNLLIYLVVSFLFIVIWRAYIAPFVGVRKRANAIIVGNREEINDIKEAIEKNSWYNLNLISTLNLDKIDGLNFQQDVLDLIYKEGVSVVIVDLDSEKVKPLLSHFYNLMFSDIKFMNAHDVYEDIFGRIPLSLIQYDWFLENISNSSHVFYDSLKRVMDVFVSLILGIISLFLYPFVYIAIKLEDKGPIFYSQERIGQGGKRIKILKFRSMKTNDSGMWIDEGDKTTKVGRFLRKTSIDEFPQLWGVLKGDQSLVGPRPELPELVEVYSKEIPYYNIRHLEKPGLSGWAQIYHKEAPHHKTDIDKTKIKLSYDLFYIKHHSFILDLKIALKTLKILFFRKSF